MCARCAHEAASDGDGRERPTSPAFVPALVPAVTYAAQHYLDERMNVYATFLDELRDPTPYQPLLRGLDQLSSAAQYRAQLPDCLRVGFSVCLDRQRRPDDRQPTV